MHAYTREYTIKCYYNSISIKTSRKKERGEGRREKGEIIFQSNISLTYYVKRTP